MDSNLLHGRLVRLAARNPDTDPETAARWQQDSQFLRLLDSEAAVPQPARQLKQDFERSDPQGDSFLFMIRALADDRLIGFVGLWGIRWTHGDTYVGIGLGGRDDWGRGYGTDAMRIVLRFAFMELNLHRVSLGVFEYNPRAIRSYEKAGFVLEGRTRQDLRRAGRYWDSLWMGVLRDEWRAREGSRP